MGPPSVRAAPGCTGLHRAARADRSARRVPAPAAPRYRAHARGSRGRSLHRHRRGRRVHAVRRPAREACGRARWSAKRASAGRREGGVARRGGPGAERDTACRPRRRIKRDRGPQRREQDRAPARRDGGDVPSGGRTCSTSPGACLGLACRLAHPHAEATARVCGWGASIAGVDGRGVNWSDEFDRYGDRRGRGGRRSCRASSGPRRQHGRGGRRRRPVASVGGGPLPGRWHRALERRVRPRGGRRGEAVGPAATARRRARSPRRSGGRRRARRGPAASASPSPSSASRRVHRGRDAVDPRVG